MTEGLGTMGMDRPRFFFVIFPLGVAAIDRVVIQIYQSRMVAAILLILRGRAVW